MKNILLLSLCLFMVYSLQGQINPHPKLKQVKKDIQVIKGRSAKIPAQNVQLQKMNKSTKGPQPQQTPPNTLKNWSSSQPPHQQTYGHRNCKHQEGFCDPRNLPLSKNGKLLSVDGYEVEFRTSGNPGVTNVCGTPRGYIDNSNNKSAGCSFTVPCDNPSNRDGASTSIKYFQLVWHVMQSTSGGASSNIDQTRIDALMTELNADYAAHNMIFCADPATFYVDDVNYTHDSNTEEVSLKTTYNVNPTQLINIYVVGSMTAGGYARFPYDPMGGTSPTGGIVLNRGNCNVGTHTLAHEMGHTFGLEHTFAGVDERTPCSACYEQVRNVNGSSNSSGVPSPFLGPYTTEGDQEGDWCSDTHPHDTYSYNCFTSSNANGSCDLFPWANAPVNNHMSYSFCSSQFTTQQSSRQHCMTSTYLSSWISYGGGICGAQPPVADFDATPTTWVSPNLVTFNDLSTPQSIITGWTWVFDVGASGTVTCAGCTGANATFVGQVPPVVTYPNVGLYTVSLTVTSANGPDTETKVDYIEVTAPANDCDTLDTDWLTPTPTAITSYSAGGNYFTGVPAVQSAAPIDPAGFYQQYFTPNPGTSIVGALTVALGRLIDPDDDMTFQIVVYEDDPGNPGFPDFGAGPVATRSYSPTQIGVPTGGFYQIYNIPFTCAPTIAGATFHVGVEMFPGDATDELVLMTNVDGDGGSPLVNTYSATGCASIDYNVNGHSCAYFAIDFDLYCYPQMGWYKPTPLALGYVEDVRCDTNEVDIVFGTLYDGAGCPAPSGPNLGMVNWTYAFADGTTYSSTTEIPVITRTYTSAGQDTVTVMALNDCGRADTTTWFIPYNFLSTPDADFTKSPLNPICMGAPGVTFTANTSGYANYTWDFGDGTPPVSTGGLNTVNHVYATPGLYYTELSVTSLGYESITTFYLETFAGGWPAGYLRFNNDPFLPDAFVNPPFTGSNATAWLPLDIDGSGDNEAVSTSWNGPAQQAEDWMITSAIGVLPANQMLSWEAEAISAPFPDGYEVRISTTQLPATVANYSTVLFSTAAENSFRTTRTANLSAYAGQTVYIAFINNSTDQYLLAIDDIKVGTIGPGCTNTEQKLDYVEIVDCTVIPPTADFSAAPVSGCAPLDVTFSDITVLGDPATSWLWNFGDAQFSTLQNPPMHTYTLPGNYYVIYQACNTGGCTIDTITVVVGDGVTSVAGPTQNLCADFTTLAGNDPAPYAGLWTVVSGAGTFTNATQYNTAVINIGAGANVYRWAITGTSGCISTSDVTINGKNFIYGLNGATSNTYCTDPGGWHHFYNGGNEILLSIRGDLSGAPAGFPAITINDNGSWYQQTQGPFTAPSCAISGTTPGEERFEMERSWNVDFGGGTLNPPYNVRFYYQPTERSDIENAAIAWMATYPACGYTYKYPYPLGFYWFKNTGSNYTAPDYDGTQFPGIGGAASGINYSQISGITSFSGGSGAIILAPSVLLVADWLYFDGVTDNKVNYLRWATESEHNSAHFNLQRSKEGIDFETIGTIPAQGVSTTTQEYNYDDVNPYVGENYYRLELVDTDGAITFSNTVLLVIADNDLGYIFYPNPTDNVVHYQYEATKAEQLEVEVVDVLGRVLKTEKFTSVIGINNIPVTLGDFPVGSYMVRVHNKSNGSVHSSKIIRSDK